MENPSAEEAAASGAPKGWGRYVGAGGVRLAQATDEQHSGESAACLELNRWYTPPDKQDSPENRSASGALILAENDGYRAGGALPCVAGARYAFSFWYKGTIPSAKVIATGWPSQDAGSEERITIPVRAAALRPGDQWQQSAGSLRIPAGVARFVVLILASGHESKGFRLGRLCVDDARLEAKQFPDNPRRLVGFVKAERPTPGDARSTRPRQAGSRRPEQPAGLDLLATSPPGSPRVAAGQPQAAWDAFGEIGGRRRG